MSWLFSRALAAEYSAATCSDGARSALLSGSPIPQALLPNDKMTAFSRPSRFGMTFGPLTDTLGAELLTWFLGASRARTSALPAGAQESLASAPACGDRWRGSLAKFDPASSSWKTAQLSLLGDSDECSPIWPRSGMTAGGQCWELPMLERPTSATGSGLWLRTPTESMSVSSEKFRGINKAPTPAEYVKRWPTPQARDTCARKASKNWKGDDLPSKMHAAGFHGALNPTWVEWLMGWPLGWTDLKPLAMDKYHCAQPQPGKY
jgi:hypothetical protein